MGRTRNVANRRVRVKIAPRPAVRKMKQSTGLPVAVTGGYVTRDRQTITEFGGDWVHSIDVPATVTSGHVLLQLRITPEMVERLERTASRYQRIRWNSVRMSVTPGFSSLAGGQYAAVFVRDPSDAPPSDPMKLLRWITANQGHKMAKWWQPMNITMTRPADLLYTSEGADARLYCPGVFYLVCVGSPGQTGNVAVYMDWNVSLTEPSLESEPPTIEPEAILAHDCWLTHYTSNGAHCVLIKPPLGAISLDPDVHDTPIPVDLADNGFSEFKEGTYFHSSAPASMLVQFKAGEGEPRNLAFVHFWVLKTVQYGTSSDAKLCVVPALPQYNSAGEIDSFRDDWAYVNSTSLANVYADIYCFGVQLRAGTVFKQYHVGDPLVPEVQVTMVRGEWVEKRTGRMVRRQRDLTPEQVEEIIPTVNIAQMPPMEADPTMGKLYDLFATLIQKVSGPNFTLKTGDTFIPTAVCNEDLNKLPLQVTRPAGAPAMPVNITQVAYNAVQTDLPVQVNAFASNAGRVNTNLESVNKVNLTSSNVPIDVKASTAPAGTRVPVDIRAVAGVAGNTIATGSLPVVSGPISLATGTSVSIVPDRVNPIPVALFRTGRYDVPTNSMTYSEVSDEFPLSTCMMAGGTVDSDLGPANAPFGMTRHVTGSAGTARVADSSPAARLVYSKEQTHRVAGSTPWDGIKVTQTIGT